MSKHVKHISGVLSQLGEAVEEAIQLGDQRAHFLCLAWVDGTVQSISNTPREDLIEVLRHHLRTLETGTLRPGFPGRGH